METVEKPLAKILTEMEKTGALLDVGYLKNLSEEKHRELESLEKKIWELAGGEFNINSPKQMGEVLFVRLGLGGAKPKRRPLEPTPPMFPSLSNWQELIR